MLTCCCFPSFVFPFIIITVTPQRTGTTEDDGAGTPSPSKGPKQKKTCEPPLASCYNLIRGKKNRNVSWDERCGAMISATHTLSFLALWRMTAVFLPIQLKFPPHLVHWQNVVSHGKVILYITSYGPTGNSLESGKSYLSQKKLFAIPRRVSYKKK